LNSGRLGPQLAMIDDMPGKVALASRKMDLA
jgi:hypothetical protein